MTLDDDLVHISFRMKTRSLILIFVGYLHQHGVCKKLLGDAEEDDEYDAETGQRSRIRHEGGI